MSVGSRPCVKTSSASVCPLSATVARRQLKLRDILHMQPGDVIPVELPDHMVLCANGVPSFKVKLGAHKGNLALQVIDPIERLR